jgi:tetratricopeptide (TPR) repeat protein
MAKAGRNDPCPCGSGRKYKRCCLEKDEAAEYAALAAVALAKAPAQPISPDTMLDFDEDEDELTPASNAVVDLIHAGKLDEAEQAARDLLQRFPEVHDGYDRLGMVYEARGDNQQAAFYYRKVVDFIRDHPLQYEPEFANVFRTRRQARSNTLHLITRFATNHRR